MDIVGAVVVDVDVAGGGSSNGANNWPYNKGDSGSASFVASRGALTGTGGNSLAFGFCFGVLSCPRDLGDVDGDVVDDGDVDDGDVVDGDVDGDADVLDGVVAAIVMDVVGAVDVAGVLAFTGIIVGVGGRRTVSKGANNWPYNNGDPVSATFSSKGALTGGSASSLALGFCFVLLRPRSDLDGVAAVVVAVIDVAVIVVAVDVIVGGIFVGVVFVGAVFVGVVVVGSSFVVGAVDIADGISI